MTSRAEQEDDLRQSALRLERKYEGWLDREMVDRSVKDAIAAVTTRGYGTDGFASDVERLADDRLRAAVRLTSDNSDLKPSVLFLCVHNAGRSQMAAGFMRELAGDQVDVFSGGSEPASAVNRAATQAMAEKGIDITSATPQPWTDDIVRASDVVVTMGCGDTCPVYPAKRYVDWQIEDPAGQSVDAVRPIRDELERRVLTLMAELGVARAPA